MPIKQHQTQDHLTKGKTKAKLPTKGKLNAGQRAMVDQLAEIKAKLEETKPLAEEAEKLRKQLLPLTDLHFANDEQAVLQGDLHTVIFSAKTDTRVIDDLNGLIAELKEKIGYDGLIGLLKLNLTDIDKHLTPLESAPYLKHVPGIRTFKGYT